LFSMLGDDDFLLPHLYADAVAALDANPGCGFYSAPTIVHNEPVGVWLKRNATWAAGTFRPEAANVIHMIRDHFINTAVVFRREVLATAGFLDRFGSDRNYVIVAAALHPFVVSTRDSAVLTIGEGSFSGGAARMAFSETDVFSHDVDYVLQSNETLRQRFESLSIESKETILDAIRDATRRDALYVFLVRSLGRGHADDAAKLLAEKELRFGWLESLVLRVFRRVAHVRFAVAALSRLVGLAYRVALRLSGRMRVRAVPCPQSNSQSIS